MRIGNAKRVTIWISIIANIHWIIRNPELILAVIVTISWMMSPVETSVLAIFIWKIGQKYWVTDVYLIINIVAIVLSLMFPMGYYKKKT